MIRNLTDPRFLGQLLEGVRAELAEGLAESTSDVAKPRGDPLRHDEVLALVDRTLENIFSDTDSRGSPMTGPSPPTEPFLPHSAVAALLQSTVEEYVDDHRPELARASIQGSRSASHVPIFTDRSLVSTKVLPGSRVVGSLEPADLRWAASLLWHRIRTWSSRHPFKNEPARVRLADRATVLLVGDWGSGIPRAQLVAGEMRYHLESSARDGIEAHVIHLGDVYYSGLPREYENRFLPYWPVHPGEHEVFGSWCLNANHDMYSGGYGYFDHLLAEERFARQESSSWFTLSNDAWSVVGLDTAWDEEGLHDDRSTRGLHGGQADLVNRLAAESGTRLILLSHHPLFNADKVDVVLRSKLAPALDAGAVHAWFWGHKHTAEAYTAREGVAHPVCLGHGGVPVYASPWSRVRQDVLWREMGHRSDRLQRWALFGFAVLDFDGPHLKVRYYTERGALSYEEDLS